VGQVTNLPNLDCKWDEAFVRQSSERVAKTKGPINPFYVLLVIAGIIFSITACAYGMMALRAIRLDADAPQTGLVAFLDEHGMALMGVELAVLAVATFAAMATDQYLSRRRKTSADPQLGREPQINADER
jgi:hypothetical protein